MLIFVVVDLSGDDLAGFVSEHELVVVDFSAEWCPPCRALAPVLEELAREMGGKVSFARIDVDRSKEIANELNIERVPTLLLFKGGMLVGRIVGAAPKEKLRRQILEIFEKAEGRT
jgi:thioredoxin 1